MEHVLQLSHTYAHTGSALIGQRCTKRSIFAYRWELQRVNQMIMPCQSHVQEYQAVYFRRNEIIASTDFAKPGSKYCGRCSPSRMQISLGPWSLSYTPFVSSKGPQTMSCVAMVQRM